MTDPDVDRRVEQVRALAENLGLQVRRADHQADGWHIVNPAIDHSVYAFSFTKPHTFILDDVERILLQRTKAAMASQSPCAR